MSSHAKDIRMTYIAALLWLAVLVSDTVGQLSFKAAASAGADQDGLARWLLLARSRWIWLGIATYCIEFFLWLAFLTIVPLSVGIILSTLNIVTVMIGGRIFFKEAITKKRLTAAALIMCGVCLVGWH
ncbi:MAG: hypothetical protein ACRD3W_02290 [Terriglobales bacterium]